MKVYFISGLAADRRVFKNIKLPAGYEAVHLDWIQANKNERLASYASRLADKIDRSEKFVLIGLSMGGMVASEIAKKHKPVGTILLSSVPTHRHFPAHFKLAYYLRLHRLLPGQVFKSASLLKRLFTTETAADKQLIAQVIRDSDPVFIKWALGAILEWKNDDIPEPLWHIHGSKDEILPVKKTNPTHIISNGTHLMVMDRGAEVSKLIAEMLKSFDI